MRSKKKPLFRILLKLNPAAIKVVFFITSYRVPWYIYKFPIEKLRKNGYEVVIYDLNDYIIENEDPHVLLQAVSEINADINTRISTYKKKGIIIFDGFGNSLGSFFVYNYAIHYPLRRIVLNTGGYMSRLIFNTRDRRVHKTRSSYLAKGFTQDIIEKLWESIDTPSIGQNMKAQETFLLTSLKDKHITNETAAEVAKNIALSGTNFSVHHTPGLRHSATVLKNSHSKLVMNFLLK